MYPRNYLRRVRRASRTVEPIGIIPRSLVRALGRFLTQLFQTTNDAVINEFRLSRYQIIVSLQSFLLIIFAPLIANQLSTHYILSPMADYLWNGQQPDIFLNDHYEMEAVLELEHFEQELYFEYMLQPQNYRTPIWASYQIEAGYDFPMVTKSAIQRKTVDLAHEYNIKSITALTNFFGDVVTFGTVVGVLIVYEAQFIIFKSFIIEFFYSLSDTLQSVLLILTTNLLVGFHSPRGWELFMETLLERFGFPPNENFVFLFVASFPVLLDTVFKYWIFRYLNKISPSTVATYHAMIE